MQSRFTYLIPTRNRERRPRASRQDRLLQQTGYRCGYCACELTRQTVTRDHVVPRAHGGRTTDDNLLASCRDCNQRKGDMDVEDFRALYFGGGAFWHEVIEVGA